MSCFSLVFLIFYWKRKQDVGTMLQKGALLGVSDPHWFQCVSRYSFLPHCGSGSGSGEPKQCGSILIRIRIVVRLCRRLQLDFDIKNIFHVGNVS